MDQKVYETSKEDLKMLDKILEGYKEGSVKDELLSKANKAHRKARKFKEWRNAANKASLRKGEVKKLVNGKWVSNKR